MSNRPSLEPYVAKVSLANSRWYAGALFSFPARAAETGGAMSVIEMLCQRGGEPPVHIHTREDEAFYLLDGAMTFRAGEKTFSAEASSFVFLPRGVPHGFIFESESVRMLGILAPGGLDEYFIVDSVPAPATTLPPALEGPRDVEKMLQQLADYGVQVVGPPLPILMQQSEAVAR
jgi:quercetin dioxygenase-like cupin family protein